MQTEDVRRTSASSRMRVTRLDEVSPTQRRTRAGGLCLEVREPDVAAAPVFRYLRRVTPKTPAASWNFGVYYVVGRDGYAKAFPDVSPASLASTIKEEL